VNFSAAAAPHRKRSKTATTLVFAQRRLLGAARVAHHADIVALRQKLLAMKPSLKLRGNAVLDEFFPSSFADEFIWNNSPR
jgi:hypothetical protein